MTTLESRPSFSERRRDNDNLKMFAVLVIAWLSLAIPKTGLADPLNGQTTIDKSPFPIDRPLSQSEPSNAIAISDKPNGKGSKPLPPQRKPLKLNR